MDVRTSTEPGYAQARARWRSTAERLWPGVVADPDAYRSTAEIVGALVDELRRTAHSAPELLALDADPSPLPDPPAVAWAGPRALLDAACAIRADELEAGGA